jgi:hypothetical protein
VSVVELKIYEPEDMTGAEMDLAVFLHGDGASLWRHEQEHFDEIRTWPLGKGKLFVSLASPARAVVRGGRKPNPQSKTASITVVNSWKRSNGLKQH